MSARTVRAFEAHLPAQGRPVPSPVDIMGRISRRGAPSHAEEPFVSATIAGTPAGTNAAHRGAGERRRAAPRTADSSDDRLAVTITIGELKELVRCAALEAMAEAAGDAPRALLDRSSLARAMGLGTSTVDRLRREGMPTILVRDSPRFELVACLAWLRGRGQQ